MSDFDRERAGRRRRHRGHGGRPRRDLPGERELPLEETVLSTPTKPHIILAKPPSHRSTGDDSASSIVAPPVQTTVISSSSLRSVDKPVVMLRSRDEGRSAPSVSLSSIAATLSGETIPAYQVQPRPVVAGSQVHSEGSQQGGLTWAPDLLRCVKLVDETWHWCDAGMEMLLDQTDYLVVGVLGLQGVGKSTLLSMLVGNSPHDPPRSFVFMPQLKEKREVGSHQTCGIDMYVTGERIIYLDTQPVLSASVLDHIIHYDKKYPTEFTSVENCVQMQSLQLSAFLMTVCNVILVLQDWFTDINFLRFLLTSEMLKPATPSASTESGSSPDDLPDYQPQIVFVQNRASRDDFSVDTFRTAQVTLGKIFQDSKLRYRGSFSLAGAGVVSGLNHKTIQSDVNLYLLPPMDNTNPDQETILSLLPEYRGYPSMQSMLRALRAQIYGIPRYLLTHTTLSEKNWFHYAARTWDQVKKSPIMAEYNRLLP